MPKGQAMESTLNTQEKKIRFSVIVITKNEEKNIIECLESTRFADEWIVMDSGSSDHTVELAQSWGASVWLDSDWQGFGIQKNRALARAQGEWILSIDADERVSPALQEEIKSILTLSSSCEGYQIPRQSYYCGHAMRYGGWWPDYVLRLFKRQAGIFSNRKVHEHIELKGNLGTLQHPLIHFTHPCLETVIHKMDTYSTAGAQIMAEHHRRVFFHDAILHGLWTFLKMYIFRAGFRDGAYGFMAALSHAEGTYYRYAKRWLMQQSPSSR
jgi:glycosyltransferase involved in cell wall biosynthesis